MKNIELAELNFKRLLHYGGTPDVHADSSAPIPCTGFCVSCEKSGFLDSGEHRLDQMSHGADTDDFEKAICKLPASGLDVPVAFLLESPGGYYTNGEAREYEGVTKQPPIFHYYWTPKISEWPIGNSPIPKSYGPYFSYILATHGLLNAYFTNIVKCSLTKPSSNQFISYRTYRDANNRDSKIRANCFNLFLSKEMTLLKPEIVFFFGKKAATMGLYAGLPSILPSAQFVTLYHPAARFVSPGKIVAKNDERIRDALSKRNKG